MIARILNEMLQSISNRLEHILSSDAAYDILDKANIDGTWSAGGCGILALTLNKLYNYPIYVIYNEQLKQVEHFFVKSDRGTFIDADGEFNEDNFLKNYKENNIIKYEPVIMKYDPKMKHNDIIIDNDAINSLTKLILKGIGNVNS